MFLSKVKKDSPGLFWCLIVFCFFQIAFTLIKLEITPFFLFGMYSEKLETSDKVSVYKVKLNDHLLNRNDIKKWDFDILIMAIENYNAQFLNNKIDVVDTRIKTRYPDVYKSHIFSSMKRYIMNDSSNLDKFRGWYKRKIRQYTKEDVKTFEVYKETYKINLRYKSFQLLSTEKIFYIE
jgi:hypothetical protein